MRLLVSADLLIFIGVHRIDRLLWHELELLRTDFSIVGWFSDPQNGN